MSTAPNRRTVITLVTDPATTTHTAGRKPEQSRILASGHNRLRVIQEALGELRALLILERRALQGRTSGKEDSLW